MSWNQFVRTTAVLVAVAFVVPPVVSAMGVQEQQKARIRVGGDIKEPKKVKHVPPAYPEDAKRDRVEGVVILEAVIGTDGTVQEGKILRSVPQLDKAALDAVMQWKYTPTLLNGEPVEVVMTVTVTFSLNQD